MDGAVGAVLPKMMWLPRKTWDTAWGIPEGKIEHLNDRRVVRPDAQVEGVCPSEADESA